MMDASKTDDVVQPEHCDPDSEPDTGKARQKDASNGTTQAGIVLLFMVLSFGLAGFVRSLPEGESSGPTWITLVCGLITIFLIYVWCRSHARGLGIKHKRGLAGFAALLPPVGVPLYLFMSLGVRRGVTAPLKTMAFAALLVGAYAGAYALGTLVGR